MGCSPWSRGGSGGRRGRRRRRLLRATPVETPLVIWSHFEQIYKNNSTKRLKPKRTQHVVEKPQRRGLVMDLYSPIKTLENQPNYRTRMKGLPVSLQLLTHPECRHHGTDLPSARECGQRVSKPSLRDGATSPVQPSVSVPRALTRQPNAVVSFTLRSTTTVTAR